jgi:integrase
MSIRHSSSNCSQRLAQRVSRSFKRAGREAAQEALKQQQSIRAAIAAWKRATAPIRGLRFHDLRHQAITKMAEVGVSDATLMAVAGHMSRRMLEHYSHVRMAAKRSALEKLESSLMGGTSATSQPESRKAN